MADTERGRVRVTLFSLEEANQTVKDVRLEMEAMVQARRELTRVDRAIEVLELAMAGADPTNPDARELEVRVARRKALMQRLQHGVERIQRRGCLVKDLERGLLDFYALEGDRLVFLCWQLGEPEVAHWHTLEGGFGQRRPIPGRLD